MHCISFMPGFMSERTMFWGCIHVMYPFAQDFSLPSWISDKQYTHRQKQFNNTQNFE